MSNNTILYKYLPTEHIKEILEKQRLKLSDGKDFNDPFDVTVVDRDHNTHIKIDGLRILCLTNSHRMKLMWSHYADSHKGVCLSVSVPSHLVYPVCYSSQIVYSDSPTDYIDRILRDGKKSEKSNLHKSTDHLPREKKIALIKDQKWKYEKEYRIVFDDHEQGLVVEKGEKPRGDSVYLSVKIQNVYLGSQINEEKEIEILDICRKNNILVKKMVMSTQRYELIAKPIKL